MANILVVDDHPAVAAAILAVLRKAGHMAAAAHDGGSALALIAEGRWDLVVTDIVMPGLDGIGLLGALRSSRPGLPVLAISGGTRLPAACLAEWIGTQSILLKPFDSGELLDRVDLLLAGAPA